MEELETNTKCDESATPTLVPAGAPAGDERDLPPHVPLRRLRAEAEIKAIGRALTHTGWNRRRAAQLLSISYRGLLYKIRQHNITAATVSKLTNLTENAKAD
jgi:DNA-binding NtrC family response regulator